MLRSPTLLATLCALALLAVPAAAEDNAGIFILNDIPLTEELLAGLAPGAELTDHVTADSYGYSVIWDDVTVRVNQKLDWDVDGQVAGIRGFLDRFPRPQRRQPPVRKLIRKLDRVVDAYGTQISPGYDEAGKAARLVLGLARTHEGFVFSHQSFYDSDGKWVIGRASDPRTLGPATGDPPTAPPATAPPATAPPATAPPATAPPATPPPQAPAAAGGGAPFSAVEKALLAEIERGYRRLGVEESEVREIVDGMRDVWLEVAPSIRLDVIKKTVESLGGDSNPEVPEEALQGRVRTRFDSPEPTAEQLERKARSIAAVKELGLPVLDSLPVIEAESSIQPRSPREVAERCLATAICSVKAETGDQATVDALIEQYDASSLFSPQERSFLADPSPAPETTREFGWRYEAMHVFLWALKQVDELQPPNAICDVARDISRIREAGPERFVPAAELRPLAEILDMADLYYRLHWAAVQLRIDGKEHPAVDESIVRERHRALNWLIRYMGQDWDHVATDT